MFSGFMMYLLPYTQREFRAKPENQGFLAVWRRSERKFVT
jgi:hypothetical protein